MSPAPQRTAVEISGAITPPAMRQRHARSIAIARRAIFGPSDIWQATIDLSQL
jgi:hypothetical protein